MYYKVNLNLHLVLLSLVLRKQKKDVKMQEIRRLHLHLKKERKNAKRRKGLDLAKTCDIFVNILVSKFTTLRKYKKAVQGIKMKKITHLLTHMHRHMYIQKKKSMGKRRVREFMLEIPISLWRAGSKTERRPPLL